ncbi:MAG: hypothetical protein AAFY46_01600, partial [Planctomycetota bacterium]
MFRIRRAKLDDTPTLLKLAKMVHFINLPPDKEIIVQKIIHSRNSFLKLVNAKAKKKPAVEASLERGAISILISRPRIHLRE